MAIVTRAGKGAPLTHPEMDTNLTDLRDGVNLMIPKTKGKGIKTDSLGTPTFPWHDLTTMLITEGTGPSTPLYTTYRDGIKQIQFSVADQAWCNFHLPHDYVPGTDLYIHGHWSHGGSNVTGGTVTWGFEMTYAKGHNQASFHASKSITAVIPVSLVQYRHMLSEVQFSTPGGSVSMLDTDLIEPDGLIFGRVHLIANDITFSGGSQPKPFLHQVDIHYQSTAVGTKQRTPDFWS